MEISSTGTTAEIIFVAFIWCWIDDSYDGDDNDDKNDDTYAHDNCDYDSHDDANNDDDNNNIDDSDDNNNDTEYDRLVIKQDR